jgi:excisionase family DNA binding protein
MQKLRPKEAAKRAGVSPQLVYRWCAERRLSHYRCGGRGRRGRILIDSDDLDAFVASLRVEANRDEGDFRHASPARRVGAGGVS